LQLTTPSKFQKLLSRGEIVISNYRRYRGAIQAAQALENIERLRRGVPQRKSCGAAYRAIRLEYQGFNRSAV